LGNLKIFPVVSNYKLPDYEITKFIMALYSQFRRSRPRPLKAHGEKGWVLLTLLLAMTLLIIFAAAIVPSITFDIKRDREEEMIHRGVQYSRAIRAYYKKFGRYPIKLEDLESTNNLRFLRKRYKDPLNCKNGKCEDFKLLHFGEVQLTLSGISGATIPGATPAGTAGGLTGGPTSSGSFSQPSTFGGNSGFGANSNSSVGQNQPTASNPQTGSLASSDTGTNSSGTGNGDSGGNQLGSGPIIGGPIVGVASLSKDKTIREFNHKNKYKDWVFVYDPAQDRGYLITTPYQPQLQGFGQQGTTNLNGQSGSSSSSGFGAGTSPSGLQNNPNSPRGGGFGIPNPPSNPPPQQ
jgi:type II secretory pathway pseudopilin PulG